MSQEIFDTLMLLALPASGKSEVRKYLAQLPPQVCRRDFHLGETVQLDDFPYVHMMRRIDDELATLGLERIFFHSPEKPFRDSRDWITLIELLNEDHSDLLAHRMPQPASAARWLLERLEAAGRKAGTPERLGKLPEGAVKKLCQNLEKEAAKLLQDKIASCPSTLEGKTLVIEFARGGAEGSTFPLPPFFGYRHSLERLSPAILEKACILYIWVTPEESRRKNQARANPNDPGSILHHGVPLEVMLKDYGCDDMEWLEKTSEKPGTITVISGDTKFYLPIARFDNRVDKTSFVREDSSKWRREDVETLHQGLKEAFSSLFERWRAIKQ